MYVRVVLTRRLVIALACATAAGVLTVGVVSAAPSLATGGAQTRPLSWVITVEDHTNAATGACGVTVFLTVPDVPGAVAYSVDVVDAVVGAEHFGGPPFAAVSGDLAGNVLKTPPGKHRWSLTGLGQSSGSCAKAKSDYEAQVKTRWKVTRAVVTLDGSSSTIGGVVRDEDGKGVQGVTVRASGRSSVKGVTDTAGGFSLEVPKGAYTVSAGASYCVAGLQGCKTSASVSVPPSRTVNFDAASGGPTAIDWVMPKRLTVIGLGGAADGLPTAAELYPAQWKADIFTTGKTGGRFACGSDVRFVWTVAPANRLVGGRQPAVACRTTLHVTRLGTYAVTAQMQRRKGGAWLNSGRPIKGEVDVRDWLIVGMGDSNGSGEGNPPFYYLRCNRSAKSYQVQTALAVEDKDPHSSVTFIHTSCSGARAEHLLNVRYAGTRPSSPSLPPQISEVDSLLEEHGAELPRRNVDVALISAGVNDLAFGPVLEYCIVHVGLGEKKLTAPSSWVLPSEESITANPCQDRKVIAKPEKGGDRIGSFIDDPTPDGLSKTLGEYVALEQRRVATERFQGLPAALKRIGVRSDRVFLAQYPDFSHDEQGRTCSFAGVARLPTSTWAWLGQQATLLNANIQKAAGPNGWPVPQWDFSAFAKRGYCSRTPYIRAIVDANLSPFLKTAFLQGHPVLAEPYADAAGPFHPTAEGHKVEADGTIPVVCRKLYKGDATCNASE